MKLFAVLTPSTELAIIAAALVFALILICAPKVKSNSTNSLNY